MSDEKPLPATAVIDGALASRNRIARVLSELQHLRVPLRITVPDLPAPASSILLAVDADSGQAILDELAPASHRARVQPHMEIEVEGMLDGIALRFRSRVLAVDEERGIGLYRLEFPTTIRRRQRRSEHRIPASSLHIKVTLEQSGLAPLTGEVSDISARGMAARIAIGRREQKGPSSRDLQGSYNCRLMLSGEQEISCRFTLRHHSVNVVKGQMLVGGLLSELPANDARALQRVVGELEREFMRKRPPGALV